MILNVDDDDATRYVRHQLLHHAGFDVTDAANAKDALKAAALQLPQLILLDVHLPDMNGLELCRRFKSDPRTSSVPVVHLSSTAVKPSDQARGLEGGADGYLVEPIDPEVLLAVVRAFMRARRAEAAIAAAANQWKATLDALTEGVALVDAEGRIRQCNSAFQRLVDISPSEITGRLVFELMGRMAGPSLDLPLPSLLQSRQSGTSTARVGDRWLSLSALPSFDEEGHLTGAIHVASDVTEQKRVEEIHRHAAAIIASSEDAIVAKNLDGVITSWNPGAERIFGYSAAEAVGRPISMLAVPGRADEMGNILARIRRGEQVTHYESVRRRKDGSLIDISLTVSPIRDSSGNIVGASKIARDITDRRRAEAARLESERRLEAALDAGRMGAWEWHIPTGVVTWSPKLEAIHGLAPGTFGGTFDDFVRDVHPDDLERVVETVRQAAREASEYAVEYRFVRPDGTQGWIEARGQVITGPNGEAERMSGICMEITPRKRAEEAAEQARTELERSNEDLRQFAYVASHDLQEPLRSISIFATLLRRRHGADLNEEAAEFVRQIAEGTERMSNLMQDLLRYSRVIECGQEAYARVELSDAARTAMTNLEAIIAESGAKITCGALPAVTGEFSQLVQVLQNLIANAVKYRQRAAPRIGIASEKRNREWLVSVTDNGIGVDRQYWETIFLPFKRLHGKDVPGSGIGLAICKRIIERHGGRMWVESTPAKGSTFFFTLPA